MSCLCYFWKGSPVTLLIMTNVTLLCSFFPSSLFLQCFFSFFSIWWNLSMNGKSSFVMWPVLWCQAEKICGYYFLLVDDHFSFERSSFFGRPQAVSGQPSPEFPQVYPVNQQCPGSDDCSVPERWGITAFIPQTLSGWVSDEPRDWCFFASNSLCTKDTRVSHTWYVTKWPCL